MAIDELDVNLAAGPLMTHVNNANNLGKKNNAGLLGNLLSGAGQAKTTTSTQKRVKLPQTKKAHPNKACTGSGSGSNSGSGLSAFGGYF